MSCPPLCVVHQRVDICADSIIGKALADILAAVKDNKVSLDAIIVVLQSQLAQLQAINANTDLVETQLAALIALATSGNVTTAQISTTLTTQILPALQAVAASTAEIKVALQTVNSTLATVASTLAAILAEKDLELVITAPIKVCIGGVNYYTRQNIIYDSETGVVVSTTPVYSLDSVGWSATVPNGVVNLDACPIAATPIPVRNLKVFYRQLAAGETLTIANILTITGSAAILSMQAVAVDSAVGTITGDTGSITIDQYVPVWGHSAQTGMDFQDQFTNSAWAVAATSGAIRVSAIYY
jgi:hypothetical protein